MELYDDLFLNEQSDKPQDEVLIDDTAGDTLSDTTENTAGDVNKSNSNFSNLLDQLKSYKIKIDNDNVKIIKDSTQNYNEKFDFICETCGGQLEKEDEYYSCVECEKIYEDIQDPVDTEKLMHQNSINSHVKIVGPNAYSLQSNLYKTSISNYSAIQKKTIKNILDTCAKKYTDRGMSSPIPINIRRKAIDLYNEVQQYCIKRSETKNVIIAACIHYAGVEMGFVPTNQEIADFMELSTRGIAKGINFLIKLRSEGKLSFDTNQNTLGSMIKTYFEYLDINDPLCYAAIIDVMDNMKSAIIGSSLYIDTKAKGVTYEVLRRKGYNIDILDFCEKCKTRKNTITNIIALLDKYYAVFKPVYKKHGLYYKRKIKSVKDTKDIDLPIKKNNNPAEEHTVTDSIRNIDTTI
jgi:transcription initiation factor TFIIIB Brf1 subunit/transcription initiation factor TFIIB